MVNFPPPLYASWSDYLSRTSNIDRMKRCHAASKRANRVHRCQLRRKYALKELLLETLRIAIKTPCAHCGSPPGGTCTGEVRLKGSDIWGLIESAEGRCCYCNSLAIESRPSNPSSGAPLPWANVGRRIGSLEHVDPYSIDGRINELSNLAWSCLWCNTWPKERRPNALDHGGHYPTD